MSKSKVLLDVSKVVDGIDDEADDAADKLVEQLKALGFEAEINSIEDHEDGGDDEDKEEGDPAAE